MALKEIMISNPKISLVAISFLITLGMTLITKHFTDQTRMREIKNIQKKSQAKIKEFKDNIEEQKKIQKEIMDSTFELMKHSFKPLLITFIPILLIFWWIRGIYIETVIANAWIWWYIGTALISSIILRKALDVV